jgi:hypothetical protein
MKLGTIFLTLMICLLIAGCIDEIRLKIDVDKKSLAIEGLISDVLDTYQIKVHYSAVLGVGNDNVLEPISGAEVMVLDDLGNVFEFFEEEPGIYQNTMQGVIGQSYHTEITLPDKTIIRSRPAMLIKAPEIDSFSTIVAEESRLNSAGNIVTNTSLTLKIDTDLSDLPVKPFLRWRVEGEYEFKENYPGALNTKTCYINDRVDLNNLKIFDTRTFSGDLIFNEPLLDTPLDYRFAIQYCFHIRQYAMTEDEYLYWKAVNAVINIDGSLFDPPPGTVKGNFLNEDDVTQFIVGYFSVGGVSYKRFFANPQSLQQIYIEPKCVNGRSRPVTPDCRDCTSAHSSSLLRPSYWQP